jgi:hypothetical protein
MSPVQVALVLPGHAPRFEKSSEVCGLLERIFFVGLILRGIRTICPVASGPDAIGPILAGWPGLKVNQ